MKNIKVSILLLLMGLFTTTIVMGQTSQQNPNGVGLPASSEQDVDSKIKIADDPASLNDLVEAYELGQVSEAEINKILIQENITLNVLTNNNIASKSKFYKKVEEQIQKDK